MRGDDAAVAHTGLSEHRDRRGAPCGRPGSSGVGKPLAEQTRQVLEYLRVVEEAAVEGLLAQLHDHRGSNCRDGGCAYAAEQERELPEAVALVQTVHHARRVAERNFELTRCHHVECVARCALATDHLAATETPLREERCERLELRIAERRKERNVRQQLALLGHHGVWPAAPAASRAILQSSWISTLTASVR